MRDRSGQPVVAAAGVTLRECDAEDETGLTAGVRTAGVGRGRTRWSAAGERDKVQDAGSQAPPAPLLTQDEETGNRFAIAGERDSLDDREAAVLRPLSLLVPDSWCWIKCLRVSLRYSRQWIAAYRRARQKGRLVDSRVSQEREREKEEGEKLAFRCAELAQLFFSQQVVRQ